MVSPRLFSRSQFNDHATSCVVRATLLPPPSLPQDPASPCPCPLRRRDQTGERRVVACRVGGLYPPVPCGAVGSSAFIWLLLSPLLAALERGWSSWNTQRSSRSSHHRKSPLPIPLMRTGGRRKVAGDLWYKSGVSRKRIRFHDEGSWWGSSCLPPLLHFSDLRVVELGR